MKTAALPPFGLVLLASVVAGPLSILAQLGVISLGLGRRSSPERPISGRAVYLTPAVA